MAPERSTVIYIGGWMRSGTTLLAEMLGAHQGVFNAGELSRIWIAASRNQICSCRAPLLQCPVWGPALEAVLSDPALSGISLEGLAQLYSTHLRFRQSMALARWTPGSEEPDSPRRRLVSAYHALLVRLREQTGCPTVVDTSKLVSGLVMHQRLLHERVLSVQLVRDPRGVAASERRAAHGPEGGAEGVPPSRSVAKSALHWTAANGSYLVGARALGANRLVVPYERLVNQPEECLRLITQRAGIDYEPDLISEGSFTPATESHVAVGNPGRLAEGPRRLTQDVSWQTELSGPARGVVDLLTSPVRAGVFFTTRRHRR